MDIVKHGFTEAEWRAIKAEIREILIGMAKLGRPITYSELAMQITTAYVHHRAPGFHSILRELCVDELDAGRPTLGVLVVKKQTGRCGNGFYRFASARGVDVADPEAYWQSEYDRVCDYWGNHDNDY